MIHKTKTLSMADWKRRVMFISAFFAIPLFILLNVTPAYAGLFDPEEVFLWYYDSYGPGALSSITHIVYLFEAAFFDNFEGVYDALVVFSIFLMLIHFFMDLIQRSSGMQITIDYLASSLLKILIAVVLINSGFDLCKGIIAISNSLMVKVNSAVHLNEGMDFFDWDAMWTAIQDFTFAQELGAVIGTAFPRLLNMLCKIIIYVFGWTRTFEIVIRTLIAGIALSDMFSDGGRMGAVRYLKKYLAVCLAGVLYLLIAYAGNMLPGIVLNLSAGSITSPAEIPNSFGIAYLAAQLTVIASMAKAGKWAEDMIGVH